MHDLERTMDHIRRSAGLAQKPMSEWTKSESYLDDRIRTYEQTLDQLYETITKQGNELEDLRKNKLSNFSEYMLKHHVWVMGMGKLLIAFLVGVITSPYLSMILNVFKTAS